MYRITTGLLIEDSKVHQVKDINNNPPHVVFPFLPFYQYFHHSGISSSEKDDFFFFNGIKVTILRDICRDGFEIKL